jgi:hypothetical protein
VFRRPGLTPCTWLATLSRDDLIERAGALSPAKLTEIDDALCAGEGSGWHVWSALWRVRPCSRAGTPVMFVA